jgi:deoxyribodipyrimidine photo-lyase
MGISTENYGIHWFRRDLRVAGNPALQWNREKHGGRVVGFFCFDPAFLGRPDFSANRFAFFLETLRALQEELRSIGSDLLVLDEGPQAAFSRLAKTLNAGSRPLPSVCSFNRDYEPFARKRDAFMTDFLEKQLKIATHHERDHLVIEPWEIGTDSGGFYQRYTPFAKRWFEKFRTPEVQNRIRAQHNARPGTFHLTWKDVLGRSSGLAEKLQDKLEDFALENQKQVPIPAAGFKVGLKMLESFEGKIQNYATDRDLPAVQGTSRFSMFLKNGSMNTAQIIAALGLEKCKFGSPDGEPKFLQELVWREFYYSILYHCPRVETEAFLIKYKDIQWENRQDYFDAWKEGKTGYPIVDAAMRELKTTGWMHNRARMIVASFLTKDLLIDWRWGEQYFMQALLDGDVAPNNGGWQWAASTGTDPQPYFRIFNPELQSEKFDADGEYIRRFVPELKSLSSKEIHNPSDSLRRRCGYPEPIVVHASRKIKALKMYTDAGKP